MIEHLLEFLSFRDPNVVMVTLAAVLLSASAAMVGCFTFVRKRALVGDAIAHSILPGVCLAFLISGEKNPFWLLLGAAITGWLSLMAMDFIVRHSKLKADTAIGAVLSIFFGLGILLLTSIQHSGSGNQAGLDKFLFGKAASMTQQDVWVFGGVAVGILVILTLFFNAFKVLSFDLDFARTRGLPIRFLEFILATITVLAVATGIQAVGVVLMAALLITPAAAARFWTDRLVKMIGLAAIFGMLSGFFGAFVSYAAPSMPTGPWIVMVLSVIALVSVVFAPKRGIWARRQLQRENRQKIHLENILKTFYALSESKEVEKVGFSFEEIIRRRHFSVSALKEGLRKLKRKGFVEPIEKNWRLTPEGKAESRRIVRLHRLWELYLNRRLNMMPDHVHNSAEAIEHIITPEVESQLLEELGHPALDPHESEIPR
ncbi:MAG: metal ABC transporter permease [Bacteroidota bacterium]